MGNEVEQKLDSLAQLEEEVARAGRECDLAVEQILGADLLAAVARIREDFTSKSARLEEEIAALKKEIEPTVIANGKTMRGQHKMAVYMRGRETWNGEKLKGYLAAQKARLKDYLSIGKPSVQFRDVKESE